MGKASKHFNLDEIDRAFAEAMAKTAHDLEDPSLIIAGALVLLNLHKALK